MSRGVVILVVGLLALVPVAADADDGSKAAHSAVVGQWARPDSILEVVQAGESLSMRIVALRNPLYLADEPGPEGTPRVDLNNPEETLRSQPLLGLELLSEYGYRKGKWQGRIYDPESGNVYKSTMHVKDGVLQMRGYIGVPMLGRTQTFEPVATCAEYIVEMIRIAELGVTSCD